MTQNHSNENKPQKKTSSKQIVAIIGIILLAAMYILTLIAAIFDNPNSMLLFRACLIGTFTIPLLIWVYIWMYGKLTRKHTMADFDLGGKSGVQKEE
ncbi:MAG: hypothetical protein IJZ34_12920 [Lachnospiraceae bacterium]|nr:hypothetical protein [Lachnospiraceae bacterium]